MSCYPKKKNALLISEKKCLLTNRIIFFSYAFLKNLGSLPYVMNINSLFICLLLTYMSFYTLCRVIWDHILSVLSMRLSEHQSDDIYNEKMYSKTWVTNFSDQKSAIFRDTNPQKRLCFRLQPRAAWVQALLRGRHRRERGLQPADPQRYAPRRSRVRVSGTGSPWYSDKYFPVAIFFVCQKYTISKADFIIKCFLFPCSL